MIYDDQQIAKLRKAGVKVVSADGKPLTPEQRDKAELDYLRLILQALEAILQKPAPAQVKSEPPQITVKPPEVTVNQPPAPDPIKEWRFTLNRNSSGQLTEIIASAVE